MKTFDTFDRPDHWASAADAFRDDFAAGSRVQIAPWGGLAILGHSELWALSRDPLADGMPPDVAAMAETPHVYRLLSRALFTKSGPAHRIERAASIAALNAVPLADLLDNAARRIVPDGEAEFDLRSDLIAPITLAVWAAIVGHDAPAAARLKAALADLGHILSPRPDPTKAYLADAAAKELRDLSLLALDRGTPFAQCLRERAGDEIAADLIAGMTFDAVDTATVGIDAAFRIAIAYRSQVTPTVACANECLRLASSTPMTMRLATGEINLDDLTIETGTVLSMIWSAGNHDPRAFPEPDIFDPSRRPMRPLMFGMGPHSCLGHIIVRATLMKLLSFLVERDTTFKGDLGDWNPFGSSYLPPISVLT